MAAPIVTSVTPAIVDVEGGQTIRIFGSNFVFGATVSVDATPAPSVVFVSSTELHATTPAGTAGYTASITVENPDTSTGTLANCLTYENTDARDFSYTTEASPDAPVAIVAPAQQEAIVGGIVRIDGRPSFSPTGLDLSFEWEFIQVPIGSQVQRDGFTFLEDDESVVSFAPDITGTYEVQLVVNDGSFDSLPVVSTVAVKVVLVPHDRGITPDASWVWNYLSDFWTRVEQRNRLETFWSAAIQIIAAEQLKLWQYDYNKSIKDIQELIQRRWVHYDSALSLTASLTSFILADDSAGSAASTFVIDPVTNAPAVPQPALSNVVSIPLAEGTFSTSAFGSPTALGRLLIAGGRSYSFSRGGILTRAVSYGIDGATTIATATFKGSAFTPSMVGMRLKVLSGALTGLVFKIIAVVDSHTLTLQQLDGSAVSFAASLSNLTYTIYPASANYNSFFADQSVVQTGQSGLFWRFSATLVSSEYDFEQQGVAPGDVLRVSIVRQDTQKSSTLDLQIVSVDRGRVGFVFNTEDLTDGVAAGGLSQSDQIALANDLQIPGLSISTADDTLLYTDQAAVIRQTVQSGIFKRSYFETTLTSTSTINVGPFSVSLVPLSIIRNSAILIADNIKSIPLLQEYVKQPSVVEQDGQLFQVSEDKLFPISHKPFNLFENADYILDDETGLSGLCNIIAGSDLVQVPFGDLIDRSIQAGDSLVVSDGVTDYPFTVIAPVDAEIIRVSTPSPVTLASASFRLTRRVVGTFLRFVSKTFTKKMPAPPRLWAEVTFFDNNDAVEANFGVLVGVTREDLAKQGATLSYKNSVAGLMYALTKGPTIANLQLASQILLGLPFTQEAGIITEINPTYKVRDDGSPLFGRIVVSATDVKGKPLGLTNIYFYPQGRQIPDPANPGKWLPAFPELSGLAINPETNLEYKTGDTVERFAALSKGTQVEDYINFADWIQRFVDQGDAAQLIRKYHSFQLVVNADITTAVDTDLVAQFVREAKPTYTKLSLALFKSLEDVITIDDSLTFSREVNVHDNVSASMPSALSLDPQNVESSYLTFEGEMFARLLSGDDLVTTQASYAISSAGGGFVTPRTGESHDGDFIRPGYVVKIEAGPNAGLYDVASVDSDQQITLSTTDHEGVPFNFETEIAQSFVVYHPIKNPITTGTGTIVNGSPILVPSFGIESPGVAVGDLLVFYAATGTSLFSTIYRVVDLSISGPSITLDKPVAETSGSYTVGIFRDALLTECFGHPNTDTTMRLVLVLGQSSALVVPNVLDPFVPCLLYPGDVFIEPVSLTSRVILDWDPSTRTVYFDHAAGASATVDVRVERRGKPAGTSLSLDMLDQIPGDSLSLKLYTRPIVSGGSGPDLTTSAASAVVSTVSGLNFDTGLNIVPGDYLVVLEGADSTRDIGYGAGIFPVLSIAGANLTLTRPLTETHAAPGILYGFQRRRPNER